MKWIENLSLTITISLSLFEWRYCNDNNILSKFNMNELISSKVICLSHGNIPFIWIFPCTLRNKQIQRIFSVFTILYIRWRHCTRTKEERQKNRIEQLLFQSVRHTHYTVRQTTEEDGKNRKIKKQKNISKAKTK